MKKTSKLSGNNKKTRGGKILPALCNITGTLIIIAVILTLIPAVLPSALGFQVYNITSGSMAPEIPIGSAVFVKDVPPATIRENEIIAFNRGDAVVVHRALENHMVEQELITKGDANSQEDFQAVTYDQFLGRVERHVPYMGGLLAMNTSRAGKLMLMLYLAAGVVLNLLAVRMRS